MKKDRAKRTQEIQRGRVRKNIEHVAGLLEQYHLKDVPCCVVEDATTVITRIDITLKQNADGVEEVWADGFSEPLKVTKLQDLQDYFDEHKDESIARYVYVWTLVPQVPSAPYFPVFWAANNNKFDSTWVRDWWEYTTRECEQCEIPLIGFNSDGDSRLRKNDFEVLFHADTERLHVKTAEGTPHPFMYLSVGKIHNTFLLGGQDYFHVQMRVRRHLLDLKRNLAVGRGDWHVLRTWRDAPTCIATTRCFPTSRIGMGCCDCSTCGRLASCMKRPKMTLASKQPRLMCTLAFACFG